MKLIVAIVKDSDSLAVSDALIERQFRVTRIASTGGFLRRGNVTLLIGVEAEQVPQVFTLLTQHTQEPEPGQHRATVFVLPAEDFVQLG
ncbi:MAG TPA: cyclic-di-AMP receptor [Anaerolineae bacterium]|nr:cyclic-di-AMP receptor [Anaerolineae bacterium]HRU95799.1 cyclic-di-AMP receptor [Anaerolineae bacterium]HXK44211.1 cyclic-di-AMP receptor [Anaerolineae bacterium]